MLASARGARLVAAASASLPVPGHNVGRAFTPAAKPPLQGEVDAPQGADGGVHCRLVLQVSFKTRQALAPHP